MVGRRLLPKACLLRLHLSAAPGNRDGDDRTDGRRLAKMSSGAEAENGAEPPQGMPVIPVKALKLIERNIADDDPPVHLAIQSTTSVLVRTHNAVIYSRLVEGRFPRYQDVFPAKTDVKIPLEVGPLRLAVEQASIVTSDESRGVDFNFTPEALTLATPQKMTTAALKM